MNDYCAIIRKTFERGSQEDAASLFRTMILNAFPTFHFHGLELTSFDKEAWTLTGKSLNHAFDISKSELDGSPVWLVKCHRVSMGKTPDKHVYLDLLSLGFVRYLEIK